MTSLKKFLQFLLKFSEHFLQQTRLLYFLKGTAFVYKQLSQKLSRSRSGEGRQSLFFVDFRVRLQVGGRGAGRSTFLQSGQLQTFNLSLEVGKSHHHRVPKARAKLVVVNQGAKAVMIQLADRHLGRVAPGKKAIFSDLDPGYWWLRASDEASTVTHMEHGRVRAGETRSWLLLTNDKKADKEATQSAE